MTDSALPPLPSLDQTVRFFSAGTAPMPQRSALDDLVIRGREELDKKDEQAWASSMRVAIQTNPGTAAEADRLARQVGLPIGDATQRIDFLRGVSLMERMRQDRIRETNPVLYKSLQSIEFARKAWDDACKAWSQYNLDQIEETMRLGEVMMFAATDLVCALEDVIARANTLSDALNAYGYPVSDAAWKASSGAMSVQAR